MFRSRNLTVWMDLKGERFSDKYIYIFACYAFNVGTDFSIVKKKLLQFFVLSLNRKKTQFCFIFVKELKT